VFAGHRRNSASAAIVKAWIPALGLATSDEVRGGLGSKVTFEHGTITWAPFVGAKVTQT
jgi:polysaccharide biosynthesis protein PslG